MPKILAAKEEQVARLFSREYAFRIPGYQRPYAWTTVQARELFEDLVGFLDANTGPITEMSPYFLGSIVLIKPEGRAQADVVDGQQRLTTLTLLLSAIRANLDPAKAADLTTLIYEKGNDVLGTTDHFRLTLRERDKAFFQNYVQQEGGLSRLSKLSEVLSDSQKNFRENAKLFAEHLGRLPTNRQFELAQFVATRCFLVVVTTPDLDSAYRIFSVLNSRGLDLAATDILKADFIGALPETQRNAYTTKWEGTEEDLGREAFSDLFSHIRMVYRKAKPQGTLLKEFREHVTGLANPSAFIDGVLLPMATAYEQLVDSAYESTEGADVVNEYLRWLNRLEFSDWIPPALAFMTASARNSHSMGLFFRDLERLAYSMLIRKAGINERIERFARLTAAIESQADLSDASSPLQLSPAEQYITYENLDGPIYLTLAARARSALLIRLDALMSGGGATYDYATITVEHVLPQNPAADSDWLKWFPEPVIRTFWTHRLGNLALLTRRKNSAASNYDFETKKKAYFGRGGISFFVITTQVLGRNDWTPEVTQQRQSELVAKLEEHWRLESRKDPVAELLK